MSKFPPTVVKSADDELTINRLINFLEKYNLERNSILTVNSKYLYKSNIT